MASTLNLDYLSRLPKILGTSSQDVLLVRRMIDELPFLTASAPGGGSSIAVAG